MCSYHLYADVAATSNSYIYVYVITLEQLDRDGFTTRAPTNAL